MSAFNPRRRPTSRRTGRERIGWMTALLLVAAQPALAATYTVTNSNDSGAGSLRQAIISANSSSASDIIQFNASTNGNPIVLQSPLPTLAQNSGNLTVTGNGAANTIIDGAGQYRMFHAQDRSSWQLTLNHLTSFAKHTSASNFGFVLEGSGYTVRNSILWNSTSGPGQIAPGNTVSNSLVKGNYASGSGILDADPLFVNEAGDDYRLQLGSPAINAGSNAFVPPDVADVDGDGDATESTPDRDLNPRIVSAIVDMGAYENQTVSVPAGITVEPTSGLTTTELGGTASFTVVLDTQPSANVTIGLSSSDTTEGTVAPSSLSFGPADWNVPQTVTVTGVDDSDFDGDVAYTIVSTPAVSTDPLYNGLVLPDVAVTNIDDEELTLSINDVTRAEGNTGTTPFEFMVSLSGPAPAGGVTFDIATAGGTAVAPTDYTARVLSGQTIPANTSTYSFTVQVNGDTTLEPDETFFVNVTNVTGATVADAQGVGTIVNDEPDPCSDISFPYTLSGADNTARVAELRQVIECANTNGNEPAVDEVDLAGHELTFADAWQAGDNALPVVTEPLRLSAGVLQRDPAAPPFRLLGNTATGELHLTGLQLRGGQVAGLGGAVLAHGELHLRDSVLEDNVAGQDGGALATHAETQIVTSQFRRNRAGSEGAAIAGRDMLLVVNSRFEDHDDASSRSLIWNDSYFAMVGSLVANNVLPAANSSLLAFTEDTDVAELRLVTIADNSTEGALLVRPGSPIYFYNSIVWGNVASHIGDATGAFNILQDYPHPGHNRSVPPGFVGGGDYRLADGSPAIDSGDSTYGFLDAFDLDGDGEVNTLIPDLDLNPRGVDDTGVVDTSAGAFPFMDIGAFERQQPSDPAGIRVDPVSGLITGENGDEASFTVVLARYPTDTVTFALTSSDPGEGMPAPAQLVFTSENWNQPQTVTVVGIDDEDVDGDQAYTIVTAPAVSADPAYSGLDAADVSVTNLDDDTASEWHVGGTVVGLAGSGLTLSLDIAGAPLAVSGNGLFQFPDTFAPGTAYTVTVATQPADPVQTCVVINGTGVVGNADVQSVVVNCGSGTTWSIGGTVTALDGTLGLRLNGGPVHLVSSSGSYTFPQQLATGASYVVSIAQQPAGQLCSISNPAGVVGSTHVDDVDVACELSQPQLQVSVDDGGEYARYGRVRDYLVVVGNTGNAPALDVQIAGQFSAAFDTPFVQWLCLDSGGGHCIAQGSGGFSTTASIPSNGSVTWIVSAPVRLLASESDATFDVAVGGAGTGAGVQSTDVNTLVLLRDGFNSPYGDGANSDEAGDVVALRGASTVIIEVPASGEEGMTLIRRLQVGDTQVDVQWLTLGGASYVRLLASGPDSGERSSAFAPVVPGQPLVIGLVENGDDPDIVLLEGAAIPLSLQLPVAGEQGDEQ